MLRHHAYAPLNACVRGLSWSSERRFRSGGEIHRDAQGTNDLPATALFPLAPLPRRHLRLRGDPEAQRPGLPPRRRADLHRHPAPRLRRPARPGGFILRTFALPHPELAGVGVAITEILIGLLVTAGLFTRIAAAAGHRPQLPPLPHRQLAHDSLLPRPGPRLLLRLAAVRPGRGEGAAGARQRGLAPLRGDGPPHPPAAGRRRDGREAAAASTRRVLLAEFAGMAVAIAGISTLLKGAYSPPARRRGRRRLRAATRGGGGSLNRRGQAASGGGSGSDERRAPAFLATRRRRQARSRRVASPAVKPPPTATPPTARRTS